MCERSSFVLVGSSTSFSSGPASVGQQGDGQLIKRVESGLHEKLIRVLMKLKWAGTDKAALSMLMWTSACTGAHASASACFY